MIAARGQKRMWVHWKVGCCSLASWPAAKAATRWPAWLFWMIGGGPGATKSKRTFGLGRTRGVRTPEKPMKRVSSPWPRTVVIAPRMRRASKRAALFSGVRRGIGGSRIVVDWGCGNGLYAKVLFRKVAERSAKLPGPPARTLKHGKPGWRPRSAFSRWLAGLPFRQVGKELPQIVVVDGS